MSSESKSYRTKSNSGYHSLMKMNQTAKNMKKRSTTSYSFSVAFLYLAVFNALPSLQAIKDLIDDDIHNEKSIHVSQPNDDIKTTPSSSYMDHKQLFCGTRMSNLVKLNVTASQSIATLWDAETFPWLVAIGFINDENSLPSLLCSAAAVSKFVLVAPAHCISGVQKSRLVILSAGYRPGSKDVSQSFKVENIIVHPDYIRDHPSKQHDLAVIKIREDEESQEDEGKANMSNGFQIFACLPEEGDDPVENCQVASYLLSDQENTRILQTFNVSDSKNRKQSAYSKSNLKILAHDVQFGPSMACSDETPHMRGYLDSHENILCTLGTEQCNRMIRGPVFCQNHDQPDRFSVVGLSTDADNWCSVGAYTRLARYSDWIYKSIEYFEGRPLLQPRKQLDSGEISDEEEEINIDEELRAKPCASSPCGLNAKCWNSGRNFMCTCSNHDFPRGNPYKGCHECTFDSHCSESSQEYKCVDNVCEVASSNSSKKVEIPEEYTKAGPRSTDYYYVSEDSLPWPQAQHECQSRSGRLAELEGRTRFGQELTKLLRRNRTKDEAGNNTSIRFWVGATDLGERGSFVWYSADNRKVSNNNWALNGRPDEDTHVEYEDYSEDKDQRCLQIDTDGKWTAFSCEFESRFVCQFHPASDREIDGNSLGINTSGQRSERQRNFETLSPKAHYKDVCGRRFIRQRGQRIVGGGIAQYGEWPWQVSLRQYKNGQFRHKCGAALLTHQWIITAAHCVKDVAPSNLLVRVGEYNVLDGNEDHPHIDRRITRVVTHSSFDRSSYEYDIALLKMVAPASFQPNIIPICLPNSNSDLVGKTGSVTGWGRRSEYGQISPVLREVHLPIISNAKCMSMYRISGQNEWIPRIFMCAGTSNGGKDSCEGDSGGPLVIKGRNGRFELAGIISWGIGCGDRNRPGVYTRISEFKKWIQRNANYKS